MKKGLFAAFTLLCIALGAGLYWIYALAQLSTTPAPPILSDSRPSATSPSVTQPPTTLPVPTPPFQEYPTLPPASTLPPARPTLPPEPQPEIFTLTFVGDCTLGSMPEWFERSNAFVNVVGTNYDHPFAGVRHLFENDDCTFINLESVLANDGVPEDKTFTFRGPTDYINILTGSSVEVANLANNHSYDFGEAGYLSTKEVLAAGGVVYSEDACATLMTTKSGLTIGIYGVAHWLSQSDMKKDVAMLQECGAEVIVAAIHWGEEYKYHPNDRQKDYAYKLIDAGVDIVWGHHPHILQPIEEYNGGIIYYSLGNFSFGGNHNPKDKDTAVLQQQIIRQPDGTIQLGELLITPCQLSNYTWKNDFQPVPYAVDSEEYLRTLTKLDGTFPGPDPEVNRGDKDDKEDKEDESDKTDPTPPVDNTDPLPPEDNTDPLPPEDNTDPVPPEDNTDPVPPEDNTDPVPPEDNTDPIPPEDNTDPLPPEDNTDPLPPEDNTDPLPPEDNTDPLPPEDNTDPVPPEESEPQPPSEDPESPESGNSV